MSGYFVQGTRIRKNDLKSTVITGMTDNTKKSVAGTYNLNDKSIGAFGAILDANISFEQAGLLFKQPVIEIAAATLEQQSTRSVIKSRSEKSLESKKLKGMFKSDLQNVVLDAILEDGDNIDDLGSMNVPLNRNNLLAAIYYGQQLENGTLDTSNEVTIVEINQSGLDNIVSSKTNPEEFKKLYKAIQVRSLNEFLKAKEINDVLFPLGSIMSLIKGLPNTFADVQIILNDLEKLGIRYTITGDYTNPNNIAFEAVGSSITDLMYAGASDNRENPVFVAIMNTPLIVQNLKTTIALNEASKNHFLMNTGTGKYLLSTLVNSATRKMNAEVLGELRSQALSFIGVASLRKALSDMIVKDPSIADRIMFHMEENDSQNPNLPYIFDVNQLFFGEIFQGDDSSTKVDRYEKALRSNVGRNNKLLKSLVLTATSYTRNPNSVFAGRKVVRFTGNTIPKRNQDYLLELVNNFEELVQTSGTSATHAISKDLFNQSLLRDNFRYTRDSVLKHISPKFMASYMRALKKVHDTFLNKLDNTTDQKERDKLFIDLFGFPEVVFLNELQQNVFRGAKNADVRIMAYNPLKKVGSKSLHVKMLTQLAKMDKLPEMKQEDAKQDLSDANNKVSDKQAVYPFKQKGEQNRELADGITVNDIPLRAFTSEVNGETVSYMVLDQFAGLSKFTDKEKRSLVFKENLKLLRSSGLTKIETWPTPDGAYHSAMALPLVFSVVSYTPDGRPVTRTYKLVKFVPSIADSKGKKKTVIWSPVTGIGDLSEGKKKMLQNKSDSMEFEVYASGRLKGELMFSEQDIAEQSKKDLKDTIDYTNDRLMQTLGSSNLPLGTSAVYVETFEFGSKEVGPHAATVAQWEDMWNNRDTSTSEGFQNADSLEESLARYNESLAMASGGEFEYVRAKQQYTEDELAAMVQQAMFGTPLTEENTTCKTSKK
jgi:hypothetical protein